MAGSSSNNENAMEQSCSHNQPSATITRPTEFVSLNQDDANDYAIDSFDFSYLDSLNSLSHVGVDPKIAFKDAFESILLMIIDWITGPKIGTGLGKAVNAAVSVKSCKETMDEIAKRYNRPENCTYLKVPRVNKEIWDAMNKNAHSSDLALQEIPKYMAHGLIPIVSLADQLANSKDLDVQKTKSMLSDSISLLGYGFYNLSMKRRNELKLHELFKSSIQESSDIPVTEQLFGDNCTTKLKDMGDMNKHSLSSLKGQSSEGWTRLPTAKPIPKLPRVPTIQTSWRQTMLQTRGISQSVQ
ncbi:uncharacterized protein LOC128166532 [Crassostrea angulata]|uniref:uncharacterized protein LOC128166532 n=1 Tax=Magallana angulata TaxID=2784310 RepID=UPI0022B1E5BE|nr:uncharacterized protein LOC128166532 [Crassostrea angulata]